MNEKIKIDFLGGASTIGASCALIRAGKTTLIVDCGIRFVKDRPLPDLETLSNIKPDAILVTHAHSDHTGGLPVLYEIFPDVPIYMTPPTAELVAILQRDSLNLMDSGLSLEREIPLYGEKQVTGMLENIRFTHHGDGMTINDIEVTFMPASHILGASMIHIKTCAGNILFSGDYSVTAQKTVPALELPFLPVDLFVTEATYGNRMHSDRKVSENRLISTLSDILLNEGRVLIPAFAIGRAQEVLLTIKQAIRNKKIPAVPVYVDGMVRQVCGVYVRHDRYVTSAVLREKRDGHPFYNKHIRPVANAEERSKVLNSRPCIIVSSSGMLSGGPSAFYASHLAPNEKDAILITGYQDEESPGRALLNLANESNKTNESNESKTLAVNGKIVEVKCIFETYNLSAHADRAQMNGLINSINPKTIALVHGDGDSKLEFKNSIGSRDIVIAEDGMALERKYPTRLRSQEKSNANYPESGPVSNCSLPGMEIFEKQLLALTPPMALRLIGEKNLDLRRPLRLLQLAQDYFCQKEIPAPVLSKFALCLEKTGLVRRSDSNRSVLWPTPTPTTTTSSTPLHTPLGARDNELEQLEEQLKATNPKGKLFELCQQNRIPFPEKLRVIKNGEYIIRYQLVWNDKTIISEKHHSPKKMMAEQLAARDLLEKAKNMLRENIKMINCRDHSYAGTDNDENNIIVSEVAAQELKSTNPKGRVNVFCQKSGIEMARFNYKDFQHLTFVSAVIILPDNTRINTKYYHAKQKKISEQAACQELLQTLDNNKFESNNGNIKNNDARQMLNECHQHGILKNIEYRELKPNSGTSSPLQPTFSIQANAILRDGKHVQGEIINVGNKKDARRLAANSLWTKIKNMNEW